MTNVQSLTLHGDRVAYRDVGTGEVLLLIHGMGGSSHSWRAVMPLLATKYRVIAPDLLGFGDSDKPRGDYSLGAFAVWLRDFLDALGIDKVTVVGHSLGGGIAMQFAHQHRDYCRRLVLVSSGGLGSDVGGVLRFLSLPGAELVLPMLASKPALAAIEKLRSRNCSAEEVTRFSETMYALQALVNRENRQSFLRTLRAVVDARGQAVCALNRLHLNADTPALIVAGDQDRVIPVEHARAAHAEMPNSRLHIIEGAMHQPQVERPDVVAGVIDEFVTATTITPAVKPSADVVPLRPRKLVPRPVRRIRRSAPARQSQAACG